MKIFETDRLLLRHLSLNDAGFILELLNSPSWLQFIGDRGVKNQGAACDYILNGPLKMYAHLGFGLFLAELKDNQIPIGICGFLKREELTDVDIGFAFLPTYCGKGYAYESAVAMMKYGTTALGFKRIAAITVPENQSSIKLLEKLGMRFEKMVVDSNDNKEVMLFVSTA